MKSLQKYVTTEQFFNKNVTFPKNFEDTKKYFIKVLEDLSPEKLSCDGELHPIEIINREKSLKNVWKELEIIADRKVTKEMVEDWAKYNNV